ncbi:MAG: hypothetical protein SGPRY_011387, partial [Prymnesium sp.]
AALRVANLSNRTLLLPPLLPGIPLDALFTTCVFRRIYCVRNESSASPSEWGEVVSALTIHGETRSSYMGKRVRVVMYRRGASLGERVSTQDVGRVISKRFKREPIILLLSTLSLHREVSPICKDQALRIHCITPGAKRQLPT